MEITIYTKKKTTREGRPYHVFLSTLPRKDGTEVIVEVKFRRDVQPPKPEDCPMNIEIDRAVASVSKRPYTAKDGTQAVAYTMWVGEWTRGSEYVDTSLDEFDI